MRNPAVDQRVGCFVTPGLLLLCIIITKYDILRNLHCAAAIPFQWLSGSWQRLERLCQHRHWLTEWGFNWISGFFLNLLRSSQRWFCFPTCFLFINIPSPSFLYQILLFFLLVNFYPCSSWLSSPSVAPSWWPSNLCQCGSIVGTVDTQFLILALTSVDSCKVDLQSVQTLIKK